MTLYAWAGEAKNACISRVAPDELRRGPVYLLGTCVAPAMISAAAHDAVEAALPDNTFNSTRCVSPQSPSSVLWSPLCTLPLLCSRHSSPSCTEIREIYWWFALGTSAISGITGLSVDFPPTLLLVYCLCPLAFHRYTCTRHFSTSAIFPWLAGVYSSGLIGVAPPHRPSHPPWSGVSDIPAGQSSCLPAYSGSTYRL
jgi:hypothetical protein